MILFETNRLVVKRFDHSDDHAFFLINGSEEVMKYIRPAKSKHESDSFLEDNIRFYKEGSVLGRYAVFTKDDNRFVGTFSYLYMSGEADFHIGYALVPEAWGLGYATELVKVGTPYFFENTARPSLFAITVPENIPSQNVLLKNGYARKGRSEEGDKSLEVFVINRNLEPEHYIQEG